MNGEDYEDDEMPTYVDVEAFGRMFREVLPDIAENLVTLEKEGAIYSTFRTPGSEDDYRYYRIRFLPREIVEFVEAVAAQQDFDSAMASGLDFDAALGCIADDRIRDRVRTYPTHTENRDGKFVEVDIRGCHASFLTRELEAIVCGQRHDRYQVLPDLGDDRSRYAVAREACVRLPIVAEHFQNRGRGRPAWMVENEYDVQDILFASLRPLFPDVRFEEWTPQLAGRSKRIDVVLPELGTVIEAKMIRNSGHARDVADELMIDIESYHTHEQCKRLIAVVYDPRAHIADPEAISKGLSGIRVKNEHRFEVDVLIVR